MEDKILYILRGIPGCGKTTLAEDLANAFGLLPGIVCCADDYHMIDGEYRWKPENVEYSHKACQNKCRFLMYGNSPRVIISNTNVTESDINIYIKMANEYGYKVFSLVVENRHGNISVHNVPDSTLDKMENKLRNSIKLR